MNSLKALLYFSIFKYPLSEEEIYLFSGANNKGEINSELEYLKNKGIVSSNRNFYFIDNNVQTVSRRIEGNKMAKAVMDKAINKGRFIAKFPYVKAVGISGALSKNYHDKDGDVDFFVIASSKRLWVARTLLMLYKKIFLLNSKKFFCINYYVTEDTLEITEKNIFTATELLTLIPICGDFTKFYNENQWVSEYLPNLKIGKHSMYKEVKKNALSNFIAFILNTKIGDLLDRLFLKLTLKKWNVKFGGLSKKDFNVAMKSTNGVSKHHPQNFQKKVINRLNQKYREFQLKYNIELEEEHA
ncbi:nucleotidyltransferase domain-containing protein [Aquimarina sp. 2201CG5-10]|uniref:nucleotidyltransferase domain-containing protein n=1 Tax=Aquimarina callyspongiae TaxID=3098150 RepID=UPI002AB591C1|nr:nucleotidyltransferase domain-containing protein [Aquimarina sp. 2201CG5-10]MDY8138872.1 nucleotidyltransferase domain-containing protein [Aquimarina sp. 2201CG5-10]